MEVWKDIEGFEGLYKVSNTGFVKSITRVVKNRAVRMLISERILSFGLNSSGYRYIVLSKSGKSYTKTVHRIVAKAFIEGDQTLDVNHIDGDKTNNNSSNLEWATRSENTIHWLKTHSEIRRQRLSSEELSTLRDLINEGKSQKQISRITGINVTTVNRVFNNKFYKTFNL